VLTDSIIMVATEIALMMEAVSTSETLVILYKSTQRNISEDCHHEPASSILWSGTVLSFPRK
jgi:hypothetical protein